MGRGHSQPLMKTVTHLLVIFSFLLLGCEENFPVYASFKKVDGSFPCLNYSVLENRDKKKLVNAFGIAEDKHCDHRVELVKYRVGSCNNPVVKTTGGDFNGYVRVEVKKGFKSLYKVQSDYKHDMEAAFDRVLKKIKDQHP